MGALASIALLIDDPRQIVEAIVVVLLILGGIARAIFTAVRGEKGSEPRPKAPQEGGSSSAPGGLESLDRWRELLTGEVELEKDVEVLEAELPPPPSPPPPPPRREPARRPRPAPVKAPARTQRSFERLTPAHETSFARTASEDDLERRRKEGFVVEGIETVAAPMASVRREIPLHVLRSRARAWRQAILTAELLGRPVALRRPGEEPGSLPS